MIAVKPISSMINLRVLLLLPRMSFPLTELGADAIMRNASGLKAVARVQSSRAPTAAVATCRCGRSMQRCKNEQLSAHTLLHNG
jgi:hypothetical protein